MLRLQVRTNLQEPPRIRPALYVQAKSVLRGDVLVAPFRCPAVLSRAVPIAQLRERHVPATPLRCSYLASASGAPHGNREQERALGVQRFDIVLHAGFEHDYPANGQINLVLWQVDSQMTLRRLDADPTIGSMLTHSSPRFEHSERHTKGGLFDKRSRVAVAALPARLFLQRSQFGFKIEVE